MDDQQLALLKQQLREAKADGYDLIAQRETIENSMVQNNQKIINLIQQIQNEEASRAAHEAAEKPQTNERSH